MEDQVPIPEESFVLDEVEDSGKPLSPMNSIKDFGNSPEQAEAGAEEELSPIVDDDHNMTNEEIIKELRNVKRQNFVTHCLLSAMIIITLAWQISEVSLILKIKDGLSNPFKFFGGITKGLLLRDRPEADAQESGPKQNKGDELSIFKGLKIPEIPLLDLPIFESSDEDTNN